MAESPPERTLGYPWRPLNVLLSKDYFKYIVQRSRGPGVSRLDMSQQAHPTLPSVLPSAPALQDGMTRCSVLAPFADLEVLVDTTPEQVSGGHARVTNPTEYVVMCYDRD